MNIEQIVRVHVSAVFASISSGNMIKDQTVIFGRKTSTLELDKREIGKVFGFLAAWIVNAERRVV
jgi:hypothetical protein